MRAETFGYRPVDTLPQQLEPGLLYYSERFHVAAHLCACGCGYEAVTAVKPDRYRLQVRNGRPSLTPSIGNGLFPCRSHYFITDGSVRWAGEYTDEMISYARRRDNPRAYAAPSAPIVTGQTIWRVLWTWLKGLFGTR